ncbi:hypothetical protein [Hwanghaeella sp.]|uniref:hypothetical protein n=1 Tax=Hwanghaeella sp. TaxID=2605943 RepID=UPI003CCB9246
MADKIFANSLSSLFGAVVALISSASAQSAEPDLDRIANFFSAAQVVRGPALTECKLSGGAETTCFSITVRPDPGDYEPGPWCPTAITDGPEAGGIWFLDGKTVDVDGNFITSLAKTFGDTKWKLYDPETGAVRFTGTLEACEAAARPDVDPNYQNYCVQCLPEYMPENTRLTYVIPLEPVTVARPVPTHHSGSGIAANGVRLDGPAPVDAILGAYTIAPFDDCGGHVNTHVGYHYHAVTGCVSGNETSLDPTKADLVKSHGGQIGIAMDGHAIFTHLMANGRVPEGLDMCNGHETEDLPYHYHAGEAGSNAILGCLAAQSGCVLPNDSTSCDASIPPRRP